MVGHESLEVRRFVVLSTGHLTEETAHNLDHLKVGDWPVCGGHFSTYGWFMWVVPAQEHADADLPADLRTVFKFCDDHGFGYVLFDCDAALVEGLPCYDW